VVSAENITKAIYSNQSLYAGEFARAFAAILNKTGVTRYQIAKFSGLTEPYLKRLLTGEKKNPSPAVITRICFAIAHLSSDVTQHDFETIFNSVGRTLFTKY